MHNYSAPALCSPDTSEARVGETAAKLKTALTQSNTHLFRDVARTSQVSYAHHGQLKNMSTCQSHATNMPRFMPMFVQVKTPTNLKRQIEGTLEESIFSHRGVRSPGQSPVGINYTQASGRQSLQLASSAHGRGLPCLPTVSYSLLTPTAPGSQLALSYPGQQAGSPGSTAGRATRSDLFRLRRATVNSVAHGRGFP